MALWRDPLDELIEELDRIVVAAPVPPNHSTHLFGCQVLAGAILRGNPQEIARVKQEPHVKAYLAHLEQLKPVFAGATADRPVIKRRQALDSDIP